MKKMRQVNSKGQATVEMAVLGSLIIVLFGALISMGVSMNEQQTALMESFRMSLRKAYDNNGFVSYNVLKHVRVPSPTGGPFEGNRQSVSAGSSVLWSIGDVENFGYMKINEKLVTLPRFDKRGQMVVRGIEDTEFLADSYYKGTVSNGITSGSVQDNITTTIRIKDAADITVSQSLGADGRYR